MTAVMVFPSGTVRGLSGLVIAGVAATFASFDADWQGVRSEGKGCASCRDGEQNLVLSERTQSSFSSSLLPPWHDPQEGRLGWVAARLP